jgi:pimeloyl-ACP methyl ester carboxylesterase
LIAWGVNDLFFSPRLALRLQHDFPDARLAAVPGSRAFVPEDRPEQLAQLVTDFLEESSSRARESSREGVFSGD